MKALFKELFSDARGQILPILAIGTAVFLGFAAISVDYGYLAWQRRELQNIADSAALAAAWELPDATDTELKLIAEEYAEDYSDSRMDGVIVEDAKKVYGTRAVEVKVKKDYKRMFGMIFKFFDDSAADSDVMSAESTAEKTLIWGLDLLPLIDLDVYPVQDPKFPSNPDKLIPDPDMRELSLAEYKTFMINRMNSTSSSENILTLWEKSDISGNFGIIELENEPGDKPDPREVINQSYKINMSKIVVKDIDTEHGKISSIEASNNDLSTRLAKDGDRAFVLAIKPGAVVLKNNGQPENLQEISPGDYLLLYLEDMILNTSGDSFLSGRIRGVYDLSDLDDLEKLKSVSDASRVRIIK